MGAEDMEINNQDSFELSESDKVSLENASVFVTDLNCSENVIRKVVDGVRPDCIRVCDPTSVFKVEKMVNVGLEKFDVVTPNLAEFYSVGEGDFVEGSSRKKFGEISLGPLFCYFIFLRFRFENLIFQKKWLENVVADEVEEKEKLRQKLLRKHLLRKHR